MWDLIRTAGAPRLAADGVGAPAAAAAVDPVALAKQYKQAQATSTAVSAYYEKQGATVAPPADVKAEAVKDLLSLSASTDLKAEDVATVKAILEKTKAGTTLSPDDIKALKDVVKSLGTKLVAASPDATAMPKALQDLVAASPNADRAIQTYKELKALQASDTHTPKRLTDDMIRMMTEGVARPRTDDVRGQAGVMGKESAIRAANALIAMPEADYKKTTDLLAGTDKPGVIVNPWHDNDPQLEKVLLLKSIGANYKAPANDADKQRNTLLFDQLTTFAGSIHDLSRDTLIKDTTNIGVAGKDSLQQRYENSCGPTTIEMLKGEQDPMYAWQLHSAGPIHGLNVNGADGKPTQIATDQKTWLETEGHGVAVSRESLDRYKSLSTRDDELSAPPPAAMAVNKDIDKRIAELEKHKPTNKALIKDLNTLREFTFFSNLTPTPAQQKQIDKAMADLKAHGSDFDKAKFDQVRKESEENTAKQADLEVLRKYVENPNVPPSTDDQKQIDRAIADLKAHGQDWDQAKADAIRAEVKDKGILVFKGGGSGMSLGDGLKEKTVGRDYDTTYVGDASNKVTDAYMDQAATSLAAGTPVPLRIGYLPTQNSGHFMLMSDVRGDKPDRQYLVSDPYSGTTQWVKEADLKDGSFAKKGGPYGFELGNAAVSHMYFPH